jgi:transposase
VPLTKPSLRVGWGHVKTARNRRTMGAHRTALAKRATQTEGGSPSRGRSSHTHGILFVLKTGIPWQMVPKEMGCGSGMNCWRRLKEWHEAGVWRRLHRVLLDRLGKADRIDWSRASLDSASVPAPGEAKRPGRIRAIAANRARSATLWSTKEAFRL